MDVMCVGEMVIDFTPGSEPRSYIRNAGGAPANVAIAIARFGFKAAFCGKMGDDDFGRFLIQTLENDDVEVLCRKLEKDAVTTMAFVNLSESGERSFTFARKPGADMMLTVDEIKDSDIETSKIIHAGSCSLSKAPASEATIHAMKLGKSKGKLISFDVNYRSLMWENEQLAIDKIHQVLPYVDLLKLSEEEVLLFGNEENIHILMKQYGIPLVVVTLGALGAKYYFKDKEFTIPGRAAKVVDATGAGDAFWGGFLSGLLEQNIQSAEQLTENGIETAIRYGNAAGWICVQKKGAIPALPTRSQIMEVLSLL